MLCIDFALCTLAQRPQDPIFSWRTLPTSVGHILRRSAELTAEAFVRVNPIHAKRPTRSVERPGANA